MASCRGWRLTDNDPVQHAGIRPLVGCLPLQDLPLAVSELWDQVVTSVVSRNHGAEAECAHVLVAGQPGQPGVVLAHGSEALGTQAGQGVRKLLRDL